MNQREACLGKTLAAGGGSGAQADRRKSRRLAALSRHLAFSLGVQALLALCLLGLQAAIDRAERTHAEYSILATEQSYMFQTAGITMRRLTAEIARERPDRERIVSLQQRLGEDTRRLAAIVARIEGLYARDGAPRLVRLDEMAERHRDLPGRLRSFLARLEAVSTTGAEDPSAIRALMLEIEIMAAPRGRLMRGVDAIAAEMRADARAVQTGLAWLSRGIVIAMIVIVLGLGLFLVRPALRDLAAAMARERRLAARLETMVRTDSLTGLLSRSGLEAELEALGAGRPYAHAIIDLNMFKPVNDSFGHAAGDALLRAVAERLRAGSPRSAFAARTGGDEFALIDPTVDTLEGAEALGRALVALFEGPVEVDGRRLEIGAAIGIALSSEVAGGSGAVASAADAAMYSRKVERRTAFAVHGAGVEIRRPDLARRAEIAEALRDGSIRPWYQPKTRLSDGVVVGFEALARWVHPEQGVLSPSAFLPDIERHGLQAEFTFAILKQVLLQLRAWRAQGLAEPPVAVNIAVETLATQSGQADIRWLVSEFADVKHLITLEITENAFLARIAVAVRMSIEALSHDGLRVSMDDFGTGYASLRHLREITFHELKIDGTFIRGIGVDRSAEIIIGGFMSIAKGLGAEVVAEGIETPEQRDFLLALGCEVGQGFLFGRAAPPGEVATLLEPVSTRDLFGPLTRAG